MMSEKLDWTQKLGDAFLAQQKEVMDTVQKLRFKAKEAGNLNTVTQEQKVMVQEKVIIIQPASPQVIYVPAYNPVVVYGVWACPPILLITTILPDMSQRQQPFPLQRVSRSALPGVTHGATVIGTGGV